MNPNKKVKKVKQELEKLKKNPQLCKALVSEIRTLEAAINAASDDKTLAEEPAVASAVEDLDIKVEGMVTDAVKLAAGQHAYVGC